MIYTKKLSPTLTHLIAFEKYIMADKCLVNFRKVPYCRPSRVAVPCIFA